MATQTFEELIAGANKIKENELPESNTHDLVGEQLLQMTNKMQEENSNNGKKFSELESNISINGESLFTQSSSYIGLDGNILQNDDCRCTEFIPVKEGDVFYYKGYINIGICVAGYNNEEFVMPILEGGNYTSTQIITIPTGINKIRACSAFTTTFQRGSLIKNSDLYKLYKSRQLIAQLDNGGYIYIAGNQLYFKKLVITDLYSGYYFYLNDGVHSSSEDNIINSNNGHIFYVNINDLTENNVGKDIILHSSDYKSDLSILSLGTANNSIASGGILNNLVNNIEGKDAFDNIAIIDESLFTQPNSYIGLDGNILQIDDCRCSEFIPVKEGDVFYYKGYINSTGICIAGYSDEEFVMPILKYGAYFNQKVIIPAGINKIRACSAFITYSQSGSLVKGNTELASLNQLINLESQLSLIDESLFTQSNSYIGFDGNIKANNLCKCTEFIPVVEGDVFYYKGFIDNTGICVAGYSDEEFVKVLMGWGNYTFNQKIIIPAGINKIRACSAFTTTFQRGSLIKNSTNMYDIILSNLKFDRLLNLKNKKVLFFGDSITEMGFYAETFGELTGCELYIRGVGGTTYAVIDKSLVWNKSLCERVDLPSDNNIGNIKGGVGLPDNVDYAFVFAGINDWGRVSKTNRDTTNSDTADNITNTHELFGSIENENKEEFCGAVRYVFRRMKEKYPNAIIYTILPAHVYSPDDYPSWNDYDLSTKNDLSSTITEQKTTEGKSLNDYRNAIRTIASFFGIKVIDSTKMGISPLTDTDKYIEGLHFNRSGAVYLTKEILLQM